MNRTPWALWDIRTGTPAPGSSTTRVRKTLEQTFETRPESLDHPGLLHMWIHLMEMSPEPEAARSYGERLVELVPDAGHLIHIPTHVDILCGDYAETVARNERAMEADTRYEAHAGPFKFLHALPAA